jgi:hypothetical protein
MSDEEYWFAPKRVGFGVGLPIRWQGWVLLLGSAAVTIAAVLALRGQPLQLVGALVPLVGVFLVISCSKTRGGCRWRSGEEE